MKFHYNESPGELTRVCECYTVNDADIIEIKILIGDNKNSNICSHDPLPLTLYIFVSEYSFVYFLYLYTFAFHLQYLHNYNHTKLADCENSGKLRAI